VLALGNAEGRGGLPSLAQGIINAMDRTITASDEGSPVSETLHDMLQTNAQIEEGDSGGPLVNSAGDVIGMDTAANTSDSVNGSGSTIGFAIPINNALSIAKQIASGNATSGVHIGLAGFMGIGVADLSQASSCESSNFGNVQTAPVNSGALVCDVYPGTPAANAGLNPGDVIVAVNGQAVSDESALTNLMANDHPGTVVSITYVDANGAKHTVSMTLIAMAK
jgi:S1-C subfamily serine protease